MSTCSECANGELHGFPPEGAPDWYCFTVSFWCPAREHHDPGREACGEFREGAPAVVRDDADW